MEIDRVDTRAHGDGGQTRRHAHNDHRTRDDYRRSRDRHDHQGHHRHPYRRQREDWQCPSNRSDSRSGGDGSDGLGRMASSTPRHDSTWTSGAGREPDRGLPCLQRDEPFPGEIPPRISDDGEVVSALDLVRNATGVRGQHGRQIAATILRTLTRRGWVFATEPFSGDQTPSSVVQADELVDFMLAGANAIGGSPYGGRLKRYRSTPGFAALLDRIERARDNHRRLQPAAPPTLHAHHGTPTHVAESITLRPVKLEPVKSEPTDTDDSICHDSAEIMPTDRHVEPSVALHVVPMVTDAHRTIDSHSARDDAARASEQDNESERLHDTTLIERLADKARTDRPLCVWESRGGMWRLVFAARPGVRPQRPWRVVAGCVETHEDTKQATVAGAGPVWIDRVRMIRQARTHMASPTGVVAVATSLDCEPPPGVFCFADDDSRNAVAFGDMWLSTTARHCLAHAHNQHDSDTLLPRQQRQDREDLVARVAARLGQAADATGDAPHSDECRRLADALLAKKEAP
ncbi:hypothetical protein psal_cds_39 [Pandoravirus salinus]|uniref:Uncharacterized protein n=1 Tax=Pandoravirus salinus TaxID=1349410 RepID=A0A291ATI8_9VIRU|nr:hypothetical protein psal_cds_39 [Pandoravirus salinus]ATE82108.1 hypothetical protein psal_cds_39 [Pandoravirus salinus]